MAARAPNARYLSLARLDHLLREHQVDWSASSVHLVVGDLSFISLRHVLPAIWDAVPECSDAVFLIKPQFEVGRGAVTGGIVTDPRVAADAIMEVLSTAREIGFAVRGFTPSPITGTHGNREYLCWLQRESPGGASGTRVGDDARTAADLPSDWEALQQRVRMIVEDPRDGKERV